MKIWKNYIFFENRLLTETYTTGESEVAKYVGSGKIELTLNPIIPPETNDPTINPLMGWESSNDTYSELKIEFASKELAIEYAKKNKINFELIEPKIRKINKKSYADNFTK